MSIYELLSLEMGLISMLTTVVGIGFGWLVRSFGRRFDKLDTSISGLHSRINEVIKNGADEHKKIAVEIARIQTTLDIENKDKAA